MTTEVGRLAATLAPSAAWRALAASWAAHHRLLSGAYAAALAVCAVAAVVPFLLGRSPLYAFVDWTPGGGRFEGAMTLVSGALLTLTGLLLAARAWSASAVPRAAWLAAGAGCLVLALDEVLMWHEQVDLALTAAGVPRLLGVGDRDLYVFAAYGIGALLLGRLLWPALRASPHCLAPLAIAGACFALSQFVDLVPWARLDRGTRGIVGPLEEIAKLLGVWSLTLTAALLHWGGRDAAVPLPTRRGAAAPVVGLLQVAILCAVAGAAINTLYLAASADVAVPRHLALLDVLLGVPGTPRALAPLAQWPWLSTQLKHPYALHDPAGLLGFLAVAIAVALAAALPLVLVVAPLLAWRPRVALLAVLAGGGAVASLPLVLALLRGRGPMVIGAAMVAMAGIVWWAARRMARSRGAARALAGAAAVAALIALLASGGALALARRQPATRPMADPTRPNILLVSIDSLRADHVGAYGYARETTPTLDALAREGVRFATVVAPTSWTLPSHLTLLTGLPPERHGVIADGQRLTDDALFLGEVLWQAGYSTAGFVSAPYLDAAYGFSQGFDLYDDFTVAQRSFAASHHGATGPLIVGRFHDWLAGWDAAGRARPFFAFLHLWDVHHDYTPPPPYDRMFDPDYRGAVSGVDVDRDPRVHAGMERRDLEHLIASYDGEIRFTDATLGGVLADLRRRGLLEHTIVAVTADHGEEFFEHGRFGHKQTLYDESLLVPLIIRYPARVPAGVVVDEQVRLMDVGPTLLGLAGVAAPDFAARSEQPRLAARDLRAWIDPRPEGALPALSAHADLVGDAARPLAALRTADRKVIWPADGVGQGEIYDLRRDPGERVPLDPRAVPDLPVLREEMAAARRGWGATGLAADVVLSPAHQERLRLLGYGRKAAGQ